MSISVSVRSVVVAVLSALAMVGSTHCAMASTKSATPFASQRALTATLNASSMSQTLPNDLSPRLQDVSADWPKTGRCLMSYDASGALSAWPGPTKCARGDVKSAKTVVLFGDSQAWMWEPAFDALGTSMGYRVVVIARASCEVADLPLYDYHSATSSTNCTSFRTAALREIVLLRPSAVVVADLRPLHPESMNQRPISNGSYLVALAKTVAILRTASPNVVLLGQHPIVPEDPTACLSAHPTATRGCGISLARAIPYFADLTYASVAAVTGAHFHSPMSWFCGSNFCPALAGTTPIYTNRYHITRTFALRLVPLLKQLLVADHVF